MTYKLGMKDLFSRDFYKSMCRTPVYVLLYLENLSYSFYREIPFIISVYLLSARCARIKTLSSDVNMFIKHPTNGVTRNNFNINRIA